MEKKFHTDEYAGSGAENEVKLDLTESAEERLLLFEEHCRRWDDEYASQIATAEAPFLLPAYSKFVLSFVFTAMVILLGWALTIEKRPCDYNHWPWPPECEAPINPDHDAGAAAIMREIKALPNQYQRITLDEPVPIPEGNRGCDLISPSCVQCPDSYIYCEDGAGIDPNRPGGPS